MKFNIDLSREELQALSSILFHYIPSDISSKVDQNRECRVCDKMLKKLGLQLHKYNDLTGLKGAKCKP